MNASKLNPYLWNGEEVSGGTFGKNTNPTSANAPQYRGRLYLKGVGWLWLSGWDRKSPNGPFISLRAQEMSDEQAAKYCSPKGNSSVKRAGSQNAPPPSNGAAEQGSDIPF